ncbi:hypothetical protein J8L70_01860 [Pseudoalteromonas sp. MMG010]|uniref:hypothetical protein n=1 Tax=Pseudoalteromonas sp. MMG010 TaxID=2822685 RepID=UPI001B3A1D91|nr:hypothetical protein [Pseudoalteromonas sp. MMG010]MBQ4831977.1 hypothetical protein [Pseudoalteromonas sp. MMG010]
MPEQYRVTFLSLADNTDSEIACANLAAKLKVSEDKITAFLNGKPLFSPCAKDKAFKQVKLLKSMGIETKIQTFSKPSNSFSAPATSDSQRDKKIFDALDYITSSLIRLEEKLDELEQRLPADENKQLTKQDEQWDDTELLIDDDFITPQKKKNPLLYTLIAGVIILCIILGIDLAFPELFYFLN